MPKSREIHWTNKSVLKLARQGDPTKIIQEKARSIVLKAQEQGWSGPPFNPMEIAKAMGAVFEANSSIADARLIATDNGPKIEYNPRQPRERVRFSIAHEIAHLLFEDWYEYVRNRGGSKDIKDEWQLEMLCNLAASEFVLPIGSLKPSGDISRMEALMKERREYDVSAEAFLIRIAKTSTAPIGVFFASPNVDIENERKYRIDYGVLSPTAPEINLPSIEVPNGSIVHACTAIGHTDNAIENWISGNPTQIECVGLPGYPGSIYPRVAGLVRFEHPREDRSLIRTIHGDVLDPRGNDCKIICQLVNDKATKWGGGIARKTARKFPEAEKQFTENFLNIQSDQRLGSAIFSVVDSKLVIASLVGQVGYGKSSLPRIRYTALENALEAVAEKAVSLGASIHMPRIGTGAAGGTWAVIEEILDDVVVRRGLEITVYEVPPKRVQLELF